jgi:hypothetical protein
MRCCAAPRLEQRESLEGDERWVKKPPNPAHRGQSSPEMWSRVIRGTSDSNAA